MIGRQTEFAFGVELEVQFGKCFPEPRLRSFSSLF
jgi:hypothetical protein